MDHVLASPGGATWTPPGKRKPRLSEASTAAPSSASPSSASPATLSSPSDLQHLASQVSQTNSDAALTYQQRRNRSRKIRSKKKKQSLRESSDADPDVQDPGHLLDVEQGVPAGHLSMDEQGVPASHLQTENQGVPLGHLPEEEQGVLAGHLVLGAQSVRGGHLPDMDQGAPTGHLPAETQSEPETPPSGRLATIEETAEEVDEESEPSGFFDGVGDYDRWCAEMDGHEFDEDGYIVGGASSDGYSEMGDYPSEDETDAVGQLSAKDARDAAKICGDDEREGTRLAALSFSEILAQHGFEGGAESSLDDTRALMRQEMGEAMRSGELFCDAFGIGAADSDEEHMNRRALQVMALEGSLPVGLLNIDVRPDEDEGSSGESD